MRKMVLTGVKFNNPSLIKLVEARLWRTTDAMTTVKTAGLTDNTRRSGNGINRIYAHVPGKLYVLESSNSGTAMSGGATITPWSKIWEVNTTTWAATLIVGNDTGTVTSAGTGAAVWFTSTDFALNAAGTKAYFVSSLKLWEVTIATGAVVALQDTANTDVSTAGTVTLISPDGSRLYYRNSGGTVMEYNLSTKVVTAKPATATTSPTQWVITPDGRYVFATAFGTHRVQRLDLLTGAVESFAGNGTAGTADGVGAAAQFNNSYAITLDPSGLYAYVGSLAQAGLRVLNLRTAEVTTLSAVGGTSLTANLSGLSHAPDGSLYTGELGTEAIRKLTRVG